MKPYALTVAVEAAIVAVVIWGLKPCWDRYRTRKAPGTAPHWYRDATPHWHPDWNARLGRGDQETFTAIAAANPELDTAGLLILDSERRKP